MIQITTHLLARAVRAGDAGLSANDSKSTFNRTGKSRFQRQVPLVPSVNGTCFVVFGEGIAMRP